MISTIMLENKDIRVVRQNHDNQTGMHSQWRQYVVERARKDATGQTAWLEEATIEKSSRDLMLSVFDEMYAEQLRWHAERKALTDRINSSLTQPKECVHDDH